MIIAVGCGRRFASAVGDGRATPEESMGFAPPARRDVKRQDHTSPPQPRRRPPRQQPALSSSPTTAMIHHPRTRDAPRTARAPRDPPVPHAPRRPRHPPPPHRRSSLRPTATGLDIGGSTPWLRASSTTLKTELIVDYVGWFKRRSTPMGRWALCRRLRDFSPSSTVHLSLS